MSVNFQPSPRAIAIPAHAAMTNEPPAGGSAAERALIEAAERALRTPRGKLAMALHLSRLKPPAPRPYHTRIALALMQDTARRLGGQVFPMRNADLVLLCNVPEEDGHPGREPFTLPASLERLFGVDAPNAALTTVWRLDDAAAEFRDYINQRQAEPAVRERGADEAASSAGLPDLAARINATDLRSMLMQQTAVELRPGRGLPLAARLVPLFREIAFTPGALRAEGDAALLSDPFVARHLATALDGRILGLLMDDLGAGGPLTRPSLLLDMPIHLNLSPASIVSPAFARLAQMAARRNARFAVELAAMDVAADPELTEFARALLHHAGFNLVLDGIDHAGLTMLRPQVLAPSLVKLAWSPRIADAPAALLAQIDTAVATIGAGRIVLQDVDGEAALVWGQSHGITRFQGPYMDAVQAASRIAICHSARACSLRQCTTRALTLDRVPRLACGNPGLLDTMPLALPRVLTAVRSA